MVRSSRILSAPSLPTRRRLMTCIWVRCGIGIAASPSFRSCGSARSRSQATRSRPCPAASSDAGAGSGGLARLIRNGRAPGVLRDEKLAEDAVQEGFLAAWRSADRFMPERGKAGTWVLTLVHRRAVDLVRREDRRRAEALTDDVEPVASSSAEDDAWLRFERERVQAALRQLPDQQREALELAYYGGFSQSELAERLGQPVGTIKSRMFAGLARLRELLADPGAGEMAWKPTPSTT